LKRLSFGKHKRLISDKQFKAVMIHNIRVSNELLTLYIAENNCDYSRLGVSVGKSCGNAVARNKWKRLMREAFRQNQEQIPSGFDYIIMISYQWLKKLNQSVQTKEIVKQPSFEQVKASFLALVDAATRKMR
jgi:ribonuclease P protein component